MATNDAPVSEGLRIKGSFRLRIREDGEIVGDSGWHQNQVTNLGVNNYLAQMLGGMAGSTPVGFLCIGSGTEPGAAATALEGEVVSRQAVTANSSNTSFKIQFTGTFASTDNFVDSTYNISNIALANSADSAGGTIFCGNTYLSSSCATNQNVECTYDVDFTTS
jgi:hypothetical protein